MGFKTDTFSWDMPWRENFELRSAALWWGSAALCPPFMYFSNLPHEPFYWTGSLCVAMGLWRGIGAFLQWRKIHFLYLTPLTFITAKKLKKKVLSHPDEQWIGRGFIWEQKQAQYIYQLLQTDFIKSLNDPREDDKQGTGIIHGVGMGDTDQYQPLKHIEGHTLIVGLPGTGKTRLFDLLVSQCIMRGESVIIIDPKSDKDLRENARKACKEIGHPEKFVYFHPAFPNESVAIDPLKNFNRPTELASRIAALMPAGGSSESFKAFSWKAVDGICQAMLICSEKPTLKRIRHYIESGVEELLIQTVEAYISSERITDADDRSRFISEFAMTVSDAEAAFTRLKTPKGTQRQFAASAVKGFFYTEVSNKYPSLEIDSLISMFEHDHAHFAKMIASLQPVLQMLTSDALGELLSPEEASDKRHIFDNHSLLEEQKVVCIGLDSLSDAQVGHMLGSILLADLASVAGARFNFIDPKDMRPINIFVDEACEVLNEPFIQLLNKGRGAFMRMFVATQSISDFAANMGSEAKANQILGNINNKFALRTNDEKTQKYLAEHMPSTVVRRIDIGQGESGSSDSPLVHTARTDERLAAEEVPLFTPQLLSKMPNLEYIAFISGGVLVKGLIPIVVREAEKPEPEIRIEPERLDEVRRFETHPEEYFGTGRK